MARTKRVSIVVHQHARYGKATTQTYAFRDRRDALQCVINRIAGLVAHFHKLGDINDLQKVQLESRIAFIRQNLNDPMPLELHMELNYLIKQWNECVHERFTCNFDTTVRLGPPGMEEP